MATAVSLPAAARRIPRQLAVPWAGELALVAGLVAFAAVVRYPNLWQIPELTDEASEVWRAYDIYRGRELPLTNITTFVGPLWNYLVAALFWISGPSPFSPRLLIMAIGTLTIVPTYLLGRELGGPRAGLIAALLLATNGGHIASNSHIAWSSCTTPLFATTGFWLLVRAVNRKHGVSLVWAGLFLGLAWQTHGTFMFLLPGVAVFALWWGRAFLRTRWVPLALVAFVIGLAPLIVFNLTSNFETVREAGRHDRAIAKTNLPMPQRYFVRAATVSVSALRIVGGAIDQRSGGMRDFLLDPKVWVYGAVAVAGLAFAWRVGQPLPALIVVSGLLIWPFFNAGVDSIPQQARYLMTMMPPIFAAIGLLLGRLAGDAGTRRRGDAGTRRLVTASPRLRVPASAIAVTLLVAYPLLPLWTYYQQQEEAGRVNEVGYSLLGVVERTIEQDENVLLDPRINLWSFGGNGGGQRTFRYLFGLRGIDTERMLADRDLTEYLQCGSSDLLLMRGQEFRKFGEGAAELERRGIHTTVLAEPGEVSAVFGLYRLQRDPCSGEPSRRERAARRDQRAAEREAEERRNRER